MSDSKISPSSKMQLKIYQFFIISGRWCACFYRLSPEMFGDGCIPAGHFFELIWFQDIPGMSHWHFKLNLDRYCAINDPSNIKNK